jgi:hypothetical protein
MKPYWDFNEEDNYVVINGYKVLDKQDSEMSSKLLKSVDKYVQKKLERLHKTLTSYPDDTIDGLSILLGTPCFFQEIQNGTNKWPVPFDGLNKPKEISSNKKAKNVGRDKKLRAGYRIIFLKLRDNNDKLKTLNELKPLILHEITHTACNHVKYREDDHGDDFTKYESIIQGL